MTSAATKSGLEHAITGPAITGAETLPMYDGAPASVLFADGSYAVIWFRGDGDIVNEMAYQRFDAAGAPIGGIVPIAPGTSGFSFVNAQLLPTGNVAVVFQDGYGAAAAVKITIVDKFGAEVLVPQSVSTTLAGEQSDVSISVGTFGIFVTWEDWNGADSSTGANSSNVCTPWSIRGRTAARMLCSTSISTSSKWSMTPAAIWPAMHC